MSEDTQKKGKSSDYSAVVAIVVALGMMYGERKLAEWMGMDVPTGLFVFIIVLVVHLLLIAVIYYKISIWLNSPEESPRPEPIIDNAEDVETDTSDMDNAPVWVIMFSYLLCYTGTRLPLDHRQKSGIVKLLRSTGVHDTTQEAKQWIGQTEHIVANHTIGDMEKNLFSYLKTFSYNKTYDAKRWALTNIKQIMMTVQGDLQAKTIQGLNTVGKAIKLKNGDILEVIQQSSDEDLKLLGLTAGYDEPEDKPEQPKEKPKKNKAKEQGKTTTDNAIEELNGLIGLKEVKEEINSLVNYIKITRQRKAMGQPVPAISYHCVFTGNPGTGKTTVARILAEVYAQLGIISEPKLVEASRADLVGGFLGQTAIKTTEIIEKAMGGVLFIDEAYTLSKDPQDSYGQEAIDTLLKQMEDHRDRLIVIIAGYTDEMERFLATNPGLKSRFTRYFVFSDYSAEELMRIFHSILKKYNLTLSPEAENLAQALFEDKIANKERTFGNARYVRNLFEKALVAQSDRLARESNNTQADLLTIQSKDLQVAVSKMV